MLAASSMLCVLRMGCVTSCARRCVLFWRDMPRLAGAPLCTDPARSGR
jgi:hypothetical protein